MDVLARTHPQTAARPVVVRAAVVVAGPALDERDINAMNVRPAGHDPLHASAGKFDKRHGLHGSASGQTTRGNDARLLHHDPIPSRASGRWSTVATLIADHSVQIFQSASTEFCRLSEKSDGMPERETDAHRTRKPGAIAFLWVPIKGERDRSHRPVGAAARTNNAPPDRLRSRTPMTDTGRTTQFDMT